MAAASAAGQGLCAVYDLDNLDTRLTTPSSVPYPADGRPAPRKPDPKAKPSKWRTPEFYFYYVIFIVTVPYMFWIVYSVSRREW